MRILRRRLPSALATGVCAALALAAPAGASAPLDSDQLIKDGVSRGDVTISLRDGFAPLLNMEGGPLGTLSLGGPSVNMTSFPAINGPGGAMYLAYNSGWREGWGHVYASELASRPPDCGHPCTEGNGGAPAGHETMYRSDGSRVAYYVRPKPIPCGLLYKNTNSTDACGGSGSQFRNYGAYEGPSGNRAYQTERPDSDRHHQNIVWTPVRREDRSRVAGGGISKAFVSDGDVFYRSNVESLTIEACNPSNDCPADPPNYYSQTTSGLVGRVTYIYGYTWSASAGRQYGWMVHSHQLGSTSNPRVFHVQSYP